MFGNLSGPTLIVILGVIFVLAIVAVVVIVVAVSKKNQSKRLTPERQAYEAGQQQAALQRAYEAGLNSSQEPKGPASPPAT